MSGAINYRLMKFKNRVIDTDVSKEVVDFEHINDVDLTRTYEMAKAMSKEELIVIVAAAVEKFPFETYRALALHAQREKE